jgi:hypothetical protein
VGTAKEIFDNQAELSDEAGLDFVISELRVALDRIESAIRRLERKASENEPQSQAGPCARGLSAAPELSWTPRPARPSHRTCRMQCGERRLDRHPSIPRN